MINNEGVSLRFLCVKAVIILVQQKKWYNRAIKK